MAGSTQLTSMLTLLLLLLLIMGSNNDQQGNARESCQQTQTIEQAKTHTADRRVGASVVAAAQEN